MSMAYRAEVLTKSSIPMKKGKTAFERLKLHAECGMLDVE